MTASTRALLLHLLPAIGLAGCGLPSNACMQVDPEATSCPAADDVDPDDLHGACGSTITAITSEGSLSEGRVGDVGDTGDAMRCCYDVRETRSTCEYGRPYLEEGAPRLAPLVRRRNGWTAGRRPDLGGLDEHARAALAARWTAAALDEHAAVAAFSRLALELMAAGAPPSLVDGAARAARDEVRHARLGFALASAFAGRPVAPGRFPFAAPVLPRGDLVALATATAREGCLGETVATALALEAARRATDPAARAALDVIARDETRHSALAWRIVRWALREGGAPVRDAVEGVFDAARRDGVDVPARGGLDDRAVLERHGLLDAATSARVARETLARVILPCAAGLLGGRAGFEAAA